MHNYILGAVFGGGLSLIIGKAGAVLGGQSVPWGFYLKTPHVGAWTYLLIGSVLGSVIMMIIQNLRSKNLED